jgi:xylan 1,4-beta-xylosidase
MRVPVKASSVRIRVSNDENVVTWRYSLDEGRTWQLNGLRMEVSGMHHNVFGGFISLKIGIYCAGTGSVRLRNFTFAGGR